MLKILNDWLVIHFESKVDETGKQSHEVELGYFWIGFLVIKLVEGTVRLIAWTVTTFI